jgi:hypothetical protein
MSKETIMKLLRMFKKGKGRSWPYDAPATAALSRRDIFKTGLVVGGAGLLSGAAAMVPTALAKDAALTLDVACDGRTWRFDAAFADAVDGDPMAIKRGTMFIVNGKIFPSGTIDAGLSSPDQEGAIGTWVCRGCFYFDFAEISEGAVPHAATTQLYMFDDGSALYSEGLEGGLQIVRPLTGGIGKHAGARGEVTQQERGTNDTVFAGLGIAAPNIQFDFDFL